MVTQVGSGGPIRLNLHADSIALRRRRVRKRVTAKKWRAARGRLKTYYHILACQSDWHRLTVYAVHCYRDDVRRFMIYRHHRERPKSGRGRMRSLWHHEPRVSTSAGSLVLQ